MKKIWQLIIRFFPIQLLFLHFRRSILLMAFWLVLFGMAGGWLFKSIGIPYLFEMPEYLGEVSFLSYLIMGVILGFFVMAYHIATYVFYSYRYTFLATLTKPLYRFSINNSVIPIVFYAFYIWVIAAALHREGFGLGKVLLFESALVFGSILSIMFSFTYFFTTLRKPTGETVDIKFPKPFRMIIHKDKKLEDPIEDDTVSTYLRNFISIRIARYSGHYNDKERLRTLQQHHVHAAIFFLAILGLLVVLSLFSSNPIFMIPAGASIVLILTMYLMIFGAIYSWLKTWTISLLIFLTVLLNYFSGIPGFQGITKAGGLDYESPPLPYSYEALDAISTDSILAFDVAAMTQTLTNWKARQASAKPKLVILNSSGGGMRSSLFTMATLQYLDSITAGAFQKNVFLITGSSGGMIGASYYRELSLQRNRGLTFGINNKSYFDILGTDILNSVGFSLALNDLFIPLSTYKKGGYKYRVNRGTAWDLRFNDNTDFILEKPFIAYRALEQSAQIPLIVLAPSIINNGQRLVISPMGLSFLTRHKNKYQARSTDLYDGVEYARFFKDRQGDSLSFVTALRLSATFPYITPMVSLPSEPKLEAVDAGARDNDGLLLTVRFLHIFKDWIAENTSGVVIVQVLAARPLLAEIKANPYGTTLEGLVKPVGAMVNSFGTLQGFTRAEILSYASEWVDFPMDLVQFDLLTKGTEISLSWHLTEREKQNIYNAVRSERLKVEYEKLLKDLK